MRKKIAWLITTGLIAGSLAVPGIAAAHTNEAIAETGGMELALPGVDFNVGIVLDEFGNLEAVSVGDPADPTDPLTIEDPHRFRFEADDDSTRVHVMAKKHKLTSTVKAGAFEDLVGQHTWSAVLFPEAGPEETVVAFEVTADGQLIVDEGAIGPLPADALATIKSDDDDEDDEGAAVTIVFTWNGHTKVLKIKLGMDDEDDDDPSAVLRIELRAKDRQRLRGELADFVDDYQWTGLLCEGTLAMVDYSIDATGKLTYGGVTLDTDPVDAPGFTEKVQERGFWVQFDEGKARLHVLFGQTDEGEWDLKVDAKTTEKCKDHDADERGKKNRPERDNEKKNHEDDEGDEQEDND